MRYIPHSKEDIEKMLAKIGAKSVDELFEQIPENLRFNNALNLPAAMSEPELMTHLQTMSGGIPAGGKTSFLGAGAYCHHVPPAVDQLLLRSELYTAYTPYQPEVSQGTLQAIFEFQTLIARIFGMGISNASLYDGATSATEAALMARRVTKRNRIVISKGVHPEYKETLITYLYNLDASKPLVTEIAINRETGQTDLTELEKNLGDDVACVIMGYPNFYGVVEPLDEVVALAQKHGALTVSSTQDPFAFGIFASPGDLGVDIATGEGQPLGVSPSFGGPGLGLFTIRDDKKLLRQMPGRVAGETVDSNGERGFVLTLSTREQHIRREKATSNICTNHGLCALSVAINLSLLGKKGFENTSSQCFSRAEYLKQGIQKIDGLKIKYTKPTFNEFTVQLTNGKKATALLGDLEQSGFLGGVDLGRFDSTMSDSFLVATTECIPKETLDAYLEALTHSLS